MDTTYLLKVFIYFDLITLLFSLLLSISTNNIFKNNSSKYIIPVYNLTVFLELVKLNKLYVIIYFTPIINIILIIYSLYRLSIMYNLDFGFSLGLMLLPVIFLPILNYKKIIEEEKKKQEDKADSVLLYNDDQLKKLNEEKTDEVKVDNVFKSDIKFDEEIPKFKANRTKYREILLEDEQIEKIERVKPVVVEKIRENKFVNKENKDKDDKIEILEL